MILDNKIKLLGDTHLGRDFIRNVPLHRRGDREKMVWEQFEKELNPQGCEVHIHMGDLFDKAVVDNVTVLRAAALYRKAANDNPGVIFYILAGNHDLSRDLEAKSSFDVFEKLVEQCPNIQVITGLCYDRGRSLVLYGWSPTIPAAERIQDLKAKYAFGHWDVDPRSAPFNLIPTLQLGACGVERAFTGHVHLPTRFKRDGVDVTVVGSMQPYAHGEDADGTIYKTLTLDEFLDTDPTTLKDACIRIRLKEGEVWDQEVDCLQLQVERVSADVEEQIDVSLGEFDLHAIFEKQLKEAELPDSIEKELRTKWQAAFS